MVSAATRIRHRYRPAPAVNSDSELCALPGSRSRFNENWSHSMLGAQALPGIPPNTGTGSSFTPARLRLRLVRVCDHSPRKARAAIPGRDKPGLHNARKNRLGAAYKPGSHICMSAGTLPALILFRLLRHAALHISKIAPFLYPKKTGYFRYICIIFSNI